MRRRVLFGVLIGLVALTTRCGSAPSVSRKTSTTTSPTTSTELATTTTTQSLQSISWSSVTVPSAVCPGLAQPVKLTPTTEVTGTFGEATIPAPAGHSFGTADDFIQESETLYGSLGPGENIAALNVWCSNTGGTVDGQIQNSLVIYTWVSGQLTVLSTLTPQQPPEGGSHVSGFDTSAGGITISTGAITTQEAFYGPQDFTCCPTGRATTVWTFNGHTFSPSTTVQVQPTGT